ncbi:sensor domain-containing diguanylate cyclase [Alteromonas oceanisediminis]|uniref:sensor domain-containing diguanylate cyclase n=1 Tax=Alteromonas oceanisediminis TaxID=2836180 RepID=UPI001BDA4493|nr:sensor domain-containing diguanylate cyclase [Alteromonas oceanisediminis]MBT0585371.1 GGDEF domain-containing protein [Alteromonas oceanisediminis]
MSKPMSDVADMHWQYDLLGSIEVGIVVVNRDYKVEMWNQFMENHSGLLPSKVVGKNLFDVFPKVDKGWLQRKAKPVFDLKTPAFLIWEQRPFLFEFSTNRPITSASSFMYQNVTLFPLASLSETVEKVCIVVYDVTDQALGQMNIERLNSELENMSRIDGLTQLFNRRYWQEQFEREYKRALRTDEQATVLMLDIDHFKRVNDTYGHQAGDKVIQALAGIVKSSVRETDYAGRYGGEEFAILLPNTSVTSAVSVAERIRETAEHTEVTHEDDHIRFTVSVGAAEFSADYATALAWLEDADQSLYAAKNGGRNQVRIHQPENR